jgi:NodT family efflux transporter outer membrane factor (OMF) lipoprotein
MVARQERRIFRSVFLAASAVLLSACSLGPFFEVPRTEDAAWRAGPVVAAWPSRDWWRGFRSAELDALIAAASADNLDIAAAAARVRQADAQLRIAGAALLPAASVVGKEDWQRSASQRRASSGVFVNTGRYTETRTYTVQPSVSYEIDVWGRLAATRDNALASALASRYDQQTVALTAVTSVASTWFQALSLQDRLDISARNLRDAEEILAAIRGRLGAGTASLLDVYQQEALVDGIRAQVPGLRSQLEQQLNGLGILIGKPPSAITVRPGTLNALALPEVAPGLPSEVLTRRPDVAYAEASLRAANANIAVARANYLPQLELSGAAGWQSLALETLFGPGSLFAQVTASVTQTIFDNGQKDAQFDNAQARYDELLADYRKAVLQAFTDVENGIQAYRLATEQERLARIAVATAQRAADIARAQLLAGTSDIVTVLQVQNTLFSDLDTLAQVRLARFQALLSLYKALGGGWQQTDVPQLSPKLLQGVL